MTKLTDTQKVNRTKPLFPIDLYTRRMPEEMIEYHFPCGETACPEDANYELHIDMLLGVEFVMPICFEHAMISDTWIERLAKILKQAEKQGIFGD